MNTQRQEPLGPEVATAHLNLSGMDCAVCAGRIETGLRRVEGVQQAVVNLAGERASIVYDPALVTPDRLTKEIRALGYEVLPADAKMRRAHEHESRIFAYGRLGAVVTAVALLWSRALPGWMSLRAGLVVVIGGGLPIYRNTYASLKARSINVDTFLTLAVVASVAIGEVQAALVIVFFVLVAELLEDLTLERARSAIEGLTALSPKKARVVRGGREEEVATARLAAGDLVIVRSGERVAADGLVVNGQASVNEAPITGESAPVRKIPGHRVFAGTINAAGVLQVRAEKVGAHTQLGRIVELVEEAETAKAPVQRLADRFATYFTPVVLAAAVVTLIATRNLVYGIAVIVVACPCAISLATPLSVVAGAGKAARRGIVVKGGRFLEALAKADTLIMDKTGTLTLGMPKVTAVLPFGDTSAWQLLSWAGAAEKYSEHAFGRAIVGRVEEEGVEVLEPEAFAVIPGLGVAATCADGRILVGNRKLMRTQDVAVPLEAQRLMKAYEEEAATPILVSVNGHVRGVMAVADSVRDSTREALDRLRGLGVRRLVMVTGDNRATATAVGKTAGISEIYSELLPENKVAVIKAVIGEGARVAMVGDGINDAPALAIAPVGIAMGAAGADVAIEAADIALMRDDWLQIPEAVLIARQTFSTIRQNLVIGMIFNLVGVSAAALGFLPPVWAAAAHVLPDVGVFLNSSRLLGREAAPAAPAPPDTPPGSGRD